MYMLILFFTRNFARTFVHTKWKNMYPWLYWLCMNKVSIYYMLWIGQLPPKKKIGSKHRKLAKNNCKTIFFYQFLGSRHCGNRYLLVLYRIRFRMCRSFSTNNFFAFGGDGGCSYWIKSAIINPSIEYVRFNGSTHEIIPTLFYNPSVVYVGNTHDWSIDKP